MAALLGAGACGSDPASPGSTQQGDNGLGGAVFLVIDEESIDNGAPPTHFSAGAVNDDVAEVGLRLPLPYFQAHVGQTIELFTGVVGDEGWHALTTIPPSWVSTGPTDNGTANFLLAGPGLGTPESGVDPELFLDQVPGVTPLRATGLAMLIGQTICAVVYDSDIAINYSPLTGNLMGSTLGIAAFEVLDVQRRFDGSSGSLPRVLIEVADAEAACGAQLFLFANAPEPRSSSEPFDIDPPEIPPTLVVVEAP